MALSVPRDRNEDAEFPGTFTRCDIFHVPLLFILIPLESHRMCGISLGSLSYPLMLKLPAYGNACVQMKILES